MSDVTRINNEIPAMDRLQKLKPYLDKILPEGMKSDRLIMSAVAELRNTPALNSCCPKSICGAILRVAHMGLEVNSLLGKVYLIPRKGEATLMLGYRGMMDLVRRSPDVLSVKAGCVYENDFFEFEDGTSPSIKHVRKWADRGLFLGVFAMVVLRNGYTQFELMSKEEVDKIKTRGVNAGGSGAWVTDYNEMAKKTVIRRLFKTAPSSMELGMAIELDEQYERKEQNLKAVLKECGVDDEDVDGEVVAEQPKTQQQKLIDKLTSMENEKNET